jgi:hypothetical protein
LPCNLLLWHMAISVMTAGPQPSLVRFVHEAGTHLQGVPTFLEVTPQLFENFKDYLFAEIPTR